MPFAFDNDSLLIDQRCRKNMPTEDQNLLQEMLDDVKNKDARDLIMFLSEKDVSCRQ